MSLFHIFVGINMYIYAYMYKHLCVCAPEVYECVYIHVCTYIDKYLCIYVFAYV